MREKRGRKRRERARERKERKIASVYERDKVVLKEEELIRSLPALRITVKASNTHTHAHTQGAASPGLCEVEALAVVVLRRWSRFSWRHLFTDKQTNMLQRVAT